MFATKVAAKTVVFRKERAFLKGKAFPINEEKSVIFQSYNRCGSMYIGDLIRRMLETKCYSAIDLAQYAFHGDKPLSDSLKDPEFLSKTLVSEGYYFGSFRSPFWFDEMKYYKTVVVLRDPRDVLVSRFYSVAYSHTPKDDKFLYDRERAQKQGIDSFVLERIPEILAAYQGYREILTNSDSIRLFKYEEMVTSFEIWLRSLGEFLGVDSDSEIFHELIGESDFKPSQEDKFAHKRSVQPGGYKTKISQATLEQVETQFGDILHYFGY
jgi:hypothetical protein